MSTQSSKRLAAKDRFDPYLAFLVFWPAMWEGRARDFVFTCRMRDEKIRVLDVIMRLDEAVRDVSIQAPSGLSKKQYKPFHNFFHAVRIWRMRTVSPPTG